MERLVNLITKNKEFWADLMVYEELKLMPPQNIKPHLNALSTFLAFVIAGSFPVLPYIFLTGTSAFQTSILVTFLTLFWVGALRSIFTKRKWLGAGLEMVFIGGLAATVAFTIGKILAQLI